MDTMG